MDKQIIIDIEDTIIDTKADSFVSTVIQNLARLQDYLVNPVMLCDTQKKLNLDKTVPMLKILERENIDFFKKNETIRIFSRLDELLKYCNMDDASMDRLIFISNSDEFLKKVSQTSAQTILFRNNKDFDDRFSLVSDAWREIVDWIIIGGRYSFKERKTGETSIRMELSLDGNGESNIETGLGFYNHMLDQIARHSGCNLDINVEGDLEVDEHHTIEDTAIVLGEAFNEALGDKKGIERYGFALPMDDCAATVLIDFGGRPDLVWKAKFRRENVGDLPTEMFRHFFKSFAFGAKCNLFIKAKGKNEHHKIEAIFKAFARAIKMAIRRDAATDVLPSTKGVL